MHDLFRHRGATGVVRYALPNLHALNFVIDEVLEGGVNASLNLDIHGKTNSFRVLGLEVEVPDARCGALARISEGRMKRTSSVRACSLQPDLRHAPGPRSPRSPSRSSSAYRSCR